LGLYENVKALCEKNNISIYSLEDKLGFPRSSICKWNENIPGVAKVKAVADAFSVSVDELIHDVAFPQKEGGKS